MTMTKRIAAVLIMGFALVTLGLAGTAAATVTVPEGYVLSGDHCKDVIDDAWEEKVDTVGDPATVAYDAPEGKYVVAYCVKAGTKAYVYTTTGMPTGVTIDHPVKDSVSHWAVLLGDLPKDPRVASPGGVLNGTCEGPIDVAVTYGEEPPAPWTIEVLFNGQVGHTFVDDGSDGDLRGFHTTVPVPEGETIVVTLNASNGEDSFTDLDTLTLECSVQPEPEYRTDTEEESYCSADGIRTIKTSGQDLIREYVWGDGEWVLGEWEPVNSWALISEETVEDEACAIAPEPEPDEPTLAETGTPEMMGWLAAIASFLTITGAVGVALRRIG